MRASWVQPAAPSNKLPLGGGRRAAPRRALLPASCALLPPCSAWWMVARRPFATSTRRQARAPPRIMIKNSKNLARWLCVVLGRWLLWFKQPPFLAQVECKYSMLSARSMLHQGDS